MKLSPQKIKSLALALSQRASNDRNEKVKELANSAKFKKQATAANRLIKAMPPMVRAVLHISRHSPHEISRMLASREMSNIQVRSVDSLKGDIIAAAMASTTEQEFIEKYNKIDFYYSRE